MKSNNKTIQVDIQLELRKCNIFNIDYLCVDFVNVEKENQSQLIFKKILDNKLFNQNCSLNKTNIKLMSSYKELNGYLNQIDTHNIDLKHITECLSKNNNITITFQIEDKQCDVQNIVNHLYDVFKEPETIDDKQYISTIKINNKIEIGNKIKEENSEKNEEAIESKNGNGNSDNVKKNNSDSDNDINTTENKGNNNNKGLTIFRNLFDKIIAFDCSCLDLCISNNSNDKNI